jgi:predicted nucleic acid-binding Zn ribbon protein
MMRIDCTDEVSCNWFLECILPGIPELEQSLEGNGAADTKPCLVCGMKFPLNRRQIYCSSKCSNEARKEASARNTKEYRRRKREGVII